MTKYRVNRFIREMVSNTEDRIVDLSDGVVTLNAVYEPYIDTWLQRQQHIQQHIRDTFAIMQETLESTSLPLRKAGLSPCPKVYDYGNN